MIRKLLFIPIVVFGFLGTSIAPKNVKLIIQINEKLIASGLSNFHMVFDSINSRERFDINYVPGI